MHSAVVSPTMHVRRMAFVPAFAVAAPPSAVSFSITPLSHRTTKRLRAARLPTLQQRQRSVVIFRASAGASDPNNLPTTNSEGAAAQSPSTSTDSAAVAPSSATAPQVKTSTEEEDERLQNDKPYVMREFGKVALAATAIGFILFCFDILVSLVALSAAAIYGIAVLLDLRFITDTASRTAVSANSAAVSFVKGMRNRWSALRRRLYNAIKNN